MCCSLCEAVSHLEKENMATSQQLAQLARCTESSRERLSRSDYLKSPKPVLRSESTV